MGQWININVCTWKCRMQSVGYVYSWTGKLKSTYIRTPPQRSPVTHPPSSPPSTMQCLYYARRARDAIITSLWRQNDVATPFWGHNDVILRRTKRSSYGNICRKVRSFCRNLERQYASYSMVEIGARNQFFPQILTADTPQLDHEDEVWSVCCEYKFWCMFCLSVVCNIKLYGTAL